MFLHSGASLHGHEYSNRPPPAQQHTIQRRSPLIRAALTTPISRPRTLTEATKPALRTRRPLSEHVPRSTDQVVRFQEPESEPEPPAATAPAAAMSEDDSAFSASELSDASQTTTNKKTALASRRRRRRAPRNSTTYLLAVPPPRLGPKTVLFQQIRPRLLLQLQQLSADSRPRPVIDVYPSSMIGTSVVALLSRKFPRIVGKRGKLSLDDVVLLKSEEYASSALEEQQHADGDGQNLDRQALVAVLSPLKQQDRAEVVLDDGSVWVAIPLANGNYDFVHEDDHGNTTLARWARRAVTKALPGTPTADPSAASSLNTIAASPTPDYRYTFSIINPLSRRHPVMASLTPTALEIQCHYTTVSTSYGRYPPSREFGRAMSSTPSPSPYSPGGQSTSPLQRNAVSDDEGESIGLPSPANERTTIVIDDALRNMITVTAVWVALRSGWSPHYKAPFQDAGARGESASTGSPITVASALATSGQAAGRRVSRHGTDMFDASALRSVESPEMVANATAASNHHPISAPVRMPSPKDNLAQLGHVRTQSSDYISPGKARTAPVSLAAGAADSGASGLTRAALRLTPRRATSTGAAFMQRRRQQQLHSDASDSERPTPSLSLRRGKFPRMLSGERVERSGGSGSGGGYGTVSPPSPGTPSGGSSSRRLERVPTRDVVGHEAPALVAPSPSPVPQTDPLLLAYYQQGLTSPTSERSVSSLSSKPGTPSHVRSDSAPRPRSVTPGTTGSAAAAAAAGRRAHSVYYAVSPLKLNDWTMEVRGGGGDADDGVTHGMVDLDPAAPHALLRSVDVDDDRLAGRSGKPGAVAGRLRSFSNWFRRLGGGGVH